MPLGQSRGGAGGGPGAGATGWGPLTAPGTATAASGAGSGTSRRSARASGRRAARGEGGGGQAAEPGAGGAGPGRGHAPRSRALRGSRAPAGPRSRPSGSGGRLAAACGERSLRPAERPPAAARRRPRPGAPRAHLHQHRAARARAAAPATEHATTSTAGWGGRGEGGLLGGARPPAHPETYGPPDLPRASPSPRQPRGSKGATCTGTEDTGEPKEVWGVGAGAPRVEGGPRSGPWRRSESPRVAAAERRQVRTLGPARGQAPAGGGGGGVGMGWVSPGSSGRCPASGWG